MVFGAATPHTDREYSGRWMKRRGGARLVARHRRATDSQPTGRRQKAGIDDDAC
jgi:hypothetical protein